MAVASLLALAEPGAAGPRHGGAHVNRNMNHNVNRNMNVNRVGYHGDVYRGA